MDKNELNTVLDNLQFFTVNHWLDDFINELEPVNEPSYDQELDFDNDLTILEEDNDEA